MVERKGSRKAKSRKRQDMTARARNVRWWPIIFFIALSLLVAGTVSFFQMNGSI
ncbi:MAG: hypothetical protein ACREFW_02580 [Rhizomicrobium sp.]